MSSTPPTLTVGFAIIAFAIAAICLAGVVLRDDLVGRIIFGFVWTAIGVFWLGKYMSGRKAGGRDEHSGTTEDGHGA